MDEFYLAWQASIDGVQADIEHRVAGVMCHLIAGDELVIAPTFWTPTRAG